MLSLQQVKDLLAAHIPVQHDSDRAVVFDYYGELYRSHYTDETGEDWQRIEPDFNPAEYTIYQCPGLHDSRYYTVPELNWDRDILPVALTKVVKFPCPVNRDARMRPVHHFVVMTFKDADVTDEVATEKAIDFLVNAGWPEEKAQPLLVI